MDVEERIRELKRELEYLEGMRRREAFLAEPPGNPYAPPPSNPFAAEPPGNQYMQRVPRGPESLGENMPYKKPAPSMNGPRKPGPYIKKL